MTKHSQFCRCKKCLSERLHTSNIPQTRYGTLDVCRLCKAPLNFVDDLQAICVALLDFQTHIDDDYKADHKEAIELARNVVRIRIREASLQHVFDD